MFTVTGKLVKTIESDVLPGGYRAGPFMWNGKDDFDQKIGRGVYIYKVKVKTEGSSAVKFEKLVLI